MKADPGTGRRAIALGAATLAVFGLAACAGITPVRMVPAEATAGPERTIALRVRVMPVTGSRDTFFGGAAFPTAEQVHEALMGTLQKARLFSAASTAPGDADLTMTMLSTEQKGFLPTTVRLVANYKITGSNGQLLWSETYDSSFSSADLGGASRTVGANEGAVRENLKAFILGVRERYRP